MPKKLPNKFKESTYSGKIEYANDCPKEYFFLVDNIVDLKNIQKTKIPIVIL